MKKFSQIFEGKSKLDLQDGALNYIASGEISAYVKKAGKSLTPEAKYICQWLIDNNSSYIKKFGGENALASFYTAGIPSDASLKELYKNIGVLVQKGLYLQIPVFQTKDQFDAVCAGTLSIDEVAMDLVSEAGRNKVAKEYDPLCHKIARSFIGASTLDYEELYSNARLGLAEAMNEYGKKSKKQRKREEAGEEELDMEKYKTYPFLSFASFLIRFRILGAIKNESHTVRIPVSVQQREKAETGKVTRSNTISGDAVVGGNDNEGQKTMFDFIDAEEDADRSVDREEYDKYMKALWKACEKRFGEKIMDMFYSYYGINGYEEMKGKDIAKKYNMSPSNVSTYLGEVKKFIAKDPACRKLGVALIELMHECNSAGDGFADTYSLSGGQTNDTIED